MSSNNPELNKTGGKVTYDDEPALIELINGEYLRVKHHFWTENRSILHSYEKTREGGIDYSIPRESTVLVIRQAMWDPEPEDCRIRMSEALDYEPAAFTVDDDEFINGGDD